MERVNVPMNENDDMIRIKVLLPMRSTTKPRIKPPTAADIGAIGKDGQLLYL